MKRLYTKIVKLMLKYKRGLQLNIESVIPPKFAKLNLEAIKRYIDKSITNHRTPKRAFPGESSKPGVCILCKRPRFTWANFTWSLFSQIVKEQNQRVSMTFVPVITNKLKSKFAEHDLDIVFRMMEN